MPESLPNLSIITTCKGRLGHLKQTLPAMLSQPGAEVVVVDYDCPDGSAGWVKREHPSVVVVCAEDRPQFNISIARNLGAAAARAEWLCFMDADVKPALEYARDLAPLLVAGRFYTVDPFVPEMYGTCVMPREAYLRAGGYDEVLEPWSYEDTDMYARLRELGLAEGHFPARLLSAIEHDDAARLQFTGSGSRWETMRRNAFYHHAKMLAARALGAPLDEERRRLLYAEVKRLTAGAPDRSEIAIRLPDIPQGRVAPGRRIEASILVALQRDDVPR
jgi:glycosyltransferase involved in cell wall biosynthesis